MLIHFKTNFDTVKKRERSLLIFSTLWQCRWSVICWTPDEDHCDTWAVSQCCAFTFQVCSFFVLTQLPKILLFRPSFNSHLHFFFTLKKKGGRKSNWQTLSVLPARDITSCCYAVADNCSVSAHLSLGSNIVNLRICTFWFLSTGCLSYICAPFYGCWWLQPCKCSFLFFPPVYDIYPGRVCLVLANN